MKLAPILASIRQNLQTKKDWGILLTAFVPIALVLGRAVADIAVSAVAILFLADCVSRRDWSWVKNGWAKAALAFWVYTIVRSAFIDTPTAAIGWKESFVWIRYILFAASLSPWTLADKRGRSWLLKSCVAAVAFLSADGIIQYIFGRDIIGNEPRNDRLTGIYNRPIFGMTIANLFAPAIFWLLDRAYIYKGAVLAAACLAVVFLSGDRMGFYYTAIVTLIWVVAVFGVFILGGRKGGIQWKQLAGTLCLFLSLGAAIMFLSPHVALRDVQSPTQRQFESTLSTAKELAESPYGKVWRSAWNIAKEYPLFGVGMHQFRYVCPDTRFGPPESSQDAFPRCYTHPHNAYLEVLSEQGIVGFLFFIAFIVIVARSLILRLLSPHADLMLLGMSAMLTVRLMPFFISTAFFNNWAAIPFWLALGWTMSYKPMDKKADWTAVFRQRK